MKLRGAALTVALTMLTVLGLAVAPGASAAVDIYSVSTVGPSNLVAGQSARLFVELNNRGDTASSTSPPLLKVQIALPPNVKFAGLTPILNNGSPIPNPWMCSGMTTVSCTHPLSLPAHVGNKGPVFSPLSTAPTWLMLDLDVGPGLTGTFPMTVTTSGGGMAAPSVETHEVTIAETPLGFGIHNLTAGTFDEEGDAYIQAGGHPYDVKADFSLNVDKLGVSAEDIATPSGGAIRDVVIDTPPGFVGDPSAVPKCSEEQLMQGGLVAGSCPDSSQVGVVLIRTPAIGNFQSAIYDMQPPHGLPAQFAFWTPVGPVRINPAVRSDGNYGLTTTVSKITQADVLLQSNAVLWGNPADPSHDAQRCAGLNVANRACVGINTGGNLNPDGVPHPFIGPEKAFITLPTNCVEDQVTTFHMDKWGDPAPEGDLTDPLWTNESLTTPTPTGCEKLPFEPSISLQPQTKQSDSPTGLDVHLHIPRKADSDPDGLVQAHLKKTTVALPDGVAFNAGAADGLAACTPQQIGLTSAIGAEPITFNNVEPTCPDAAKIGSGEVITPLLENHLHGEVFLASQNQNPFNSTFAIYVVVREPSILVKLAGKVDLNKQTGQITTTFDDNPQLPFEDFILSFYGGPRGALATPVTCGSFSSNTEFVPWSAKDPDHPTPAEIVNGNDPFTIDSSPSGACVSDKAQLPLNVGLNAGSRDPIAGAHSPFDIQITRPDGNQELDKLEISPPPGFIASLKSIPYCSEAQITATAARASGKAEQESSTCPPASQVGTTSVGAGAGSEPFYAPGKLYLAGPYRGQTLSVVAVTPAIAGPYDLGNVVVRSALKIDPRTARITATTDPLPRAIEGVPLRIRDIRIALDRPNWAINPTNCEAMSVDVTAFGANGAVSKPSNRYQVKGCENLGFKPKLSIHLKGGTKRGDHPALLATLKGRAGDANIASAAVTLPPSAFLDQSHIRTICTRVQYAASQCPKGATYGYAKATTPLLDDPIQGEVILRSSDHKLPDLVGSLKGVANIELVGRIDSVHGGIRNSFEVVPDAPVDTFTLTMQGGNKGLVVNSKNLCAGTNRATVKLVAQSGKRYDFRPPVVADGCKKAKKHKHKKHKKR